jgi:hypothetical protein
MGSPLNFRLECGLASNRFLAMPYPVPFCVETQIVPICLLANSFAFECPSAVVRNFLNWKNSLGARHSLCVAHILALTLTGRGREKFVARLWQVFRRLH